jgi:pilus assembly protein CpaE
MFQLFNRPAAGAKRILQIGFVTQDSEIGAQLKEFVSKRDGIDLRLIASASVTAAVAPKDISVFVYDLDATHDASLQEFDRFMTQRPQAVPVIVLSPAITDDLVRWFLRLRVADWIKTPLSPGELIAACGRVISQASPKKQDVKCLTFMGARGGVGATTIAIHAALILSGRSAPAAPACLIDLDLISGSCADYLDLAPGWQVEELISNPGRLDGHMLDGMIATHAAGIAVLSAQRKFCERHAVTDEVVTRALDLASQKYTNLVIDLPRHAESWTEPVLLGSTQIFVVTEFTIPGLKAAKRLTTDIMERFGGEVTPKVIVNNYRRSLLGSSISMHEVKEILRGSFAGTVGAEERLIREAIDRGIPTTAIKPRNAVMTDLAKILEA